jgi:hypothetical protein
VAEEAGGQAVEVVVTVNGDGYGNYPLPFIVLSFFTCLGKVSIVYGTVFCLFRLDVFFLNQKSGCFPP